MPERQFTLAMRRLVVTDYGDWWNMRELVGGRWVRTNLVSHRGWRENKTLRTIPPVREVDDGFGNLVTVRFCAQCRRWQPQRVPFFAAARRDPKTRRVLVWESWCAECRNRKTAEREASLPPEVRREQIRARDERIRADPVRRARMAEVKRESDRRRSKDPEFQERRRERRRAAYQRLKADSERYAVYLANRRMHHRMKQYDLGREDLRRFQNAPGAWRPSTSGGADVSVPALPLMVWMWSVLEREVPDLGRPAGGIGHRDNRSRTVVDLAAELGVDPRQTTMLRALEYDRVTVALADRMLTRYGRPVVLRGDRAAQAAAEHCRRMAGNGERILRYIDLADLIAERVGLVVSGVGDLWSDEQLAGEDRHAILTAWEM